MPNSKGFRRKTRSLFYRTPRQRIEYRNPEKFEIGQSVSILINSSIHSGMPNYRFQGRSGKIIEVKKNTYIIHFPKLSKKLQTNKFHLKLLKHGI